MCVYLYGMITIGKIINIYGRKGKSIYVLDRHVQKKMKTPRYDMLELVRKITICDLFIHIE